MPTACSWDSTLASLSSLPTSETDLILRQVYLTALLTRLSMTLPSSVRGHDHRLVGHDQVER